MKYQVQFLLVSLALLCTPSPGAPFGSAFNYQGRLDDAGTSATGLYDLRFALYDVVTNGSAVGGALTNLAALVTKGLFTARLEFGAGVFDGNARWLEISVRSNGSAAEFTTLSPRQPLMPTPYAIRAANFSGPVAANQLTGTISSSNIGAGSITTVMLAPGAVGSNQLAAGAVTADKVATVTVPVPLATFTSPIPAYDYIGHSVAAMGTDRVLIGVSSDRVGAFDVGAAYLFSTGGALLMTFTNPMPLVDDDSGFFVAAVGGDRVLIGAPDDSTGASGAGAAYLFSTNGALLTAFTNPTPADFDSFGRSVAAVGTDRVLIGAPYDDTGATNAGAVYLFSADGQLLTTFTNPTPADYDIFGSSVAALGTDRVLIGASHDDTGAYDAGVVYLFSTDGELLTTFTNPTPASGEYFGSSLAAVGNSRVIIGAHSDRSMGAPNAGAAYLFSTNGALLMTFTKPTPEAYDYFGDPVAAVGSDRLLIGAFGDDTAGPSAGAAYVFSTNGALLATITKPSPTTGDFFGTSVASVGSNRVLIGARFVDTSIMNSGAAYLFSLETITPGLVAEGVKADSITTDSLADGAVTAAKLDPTIGVWTRSGDDVFRLAGNVGIGTSSFTSNRLEVAGMVGATTFNTTSDRAAKQDFTVVDTQAVLAKVTALPISQWRFKEFPAALHLGPMAQDFRAVFGLGLDDKSIATVDADGVALAAIQGLNQKLEAKNAALEKEVAELKALVKQLAEELNSSGR